MKHIPVTESKSASAAPPFRGLVLPNFLIIGAQKGGTTWMYEIFREHPQIFMPELKELEFFSYLNKPVRIGLEGYAEHFAGVTTERAIGEKTPSYLWNSIEYPEWCARPKGFQPDIPGTVRRYLGPDIKLIVSLREPSSRAVSGLLHHIRWGNVQRGESILEAGKRHGIIHLGFYYEHLRHWFEVFDRNQIKVMMFEEIMQDRAAACKELFTFLEVDPLFRPKQLDAVVHKGIEKVTLDGAVYIPKENVQIQAKDEVTREQLDLVARRSEIDFLKGLYYTDIRRLEELLGRDLSVWYAQ